MFKNKTVLITGGASGIGHLSAINFAKEGANIVIADCNKEGLDTVVDEIKQITPNVIGCVVDVRDYSQVADCRDKAVETFGSIDILECCAGGNECRMLNYKGNSEFMELPIDVIDYGLDLNLKGALYFDHAVMQQMKKQKSGVVINFGSVTGEEGTHAGVGYSASKCALANGVIKSLALAGAPYNIRACAIVPGPVLTRPSMAGMKTLLGYAAETHEIVDMVLYLASDKARSITGSKIVIDGGRLIAPNK